jgi:hypothetical protein
MLSNQRSRRNQAVNFNKRRIYPSDSKFPSLILGEGKKWTRVLRSIVHPRGIPAKIPVSLDERQQMELVCVIYKFRLINEMGSQDSHE